MNSGKYAITIVSIILLVWVILMILLSIFADGWFYSIEQPVQVVSVDQDRAVLRFGRTSKLSMAGTCSRELVCSGLVTPYVATDCVVEKGHAVFTYGYIVPEFVNGTCYYSGLVEYEPMGIFGPRLSYWWRSEEFELLDNNVNE